MATRDDQNLLGLRTKNQNQSLLEIRREIRKTQTRLDVLDGEMRLLAEGIVMNGDAIQRLQEENERHVAALWSLLLSLGSS